MQLSTGQVLSIVQDTLCCPVGALYAALNYLTGDKLWTHQLSRACDAVQAHVLAQCPWAARFDSARCTPETVWGMVGEMSAAYAAFHELAPLPPGTWESRDPLEEAVEMVGDPKKVMFVERRDPGRN